MKFIIMALALMAMFSTASAFSFASDLARDQQRSADSARARGQAPDIYSSPQDEICPDGYKLIKGSIGSSSCHMPNGCPSLNDEHCIVSKNEVKKFCANADCATISEPTNAGWRRRYPDAVQIYCGQDTTTAGGWNVCQRILNTEIAKGCTVPDWTAEEFETWSMEGNCAEIDERYDTHICTYPNFKDVCCTYCTSQAAQEAVGSSSGFVFGINWFYAIVPVAGFAGYYVGKRNKERTVDENYEKIEMI